MIKKTALVTGGVRGIGRAIVDCLVARGDRVFVFDCLSATDSVVLDLCAHSVEYFQTDVASVTSVQKSFSDLFLRTNSLDICVNNAGITKDNLAIRMSESEWDAVLDVNLKGAFFCTQEALKRMIKQKKSYIIMIGSVIGRIGNPGQVNYAASKAGLVAITKTLAQEYGKRNVLINTLAPGFIESSMTQMLSEDIKKKAIDHIPLQRFGASTDIARFVEFLTSGDADYVTGQVIDISGGMFS